MSEDPIRKYSDAIAELNSAYSKVRKLGEIIADVAHALNAKPYELMVENVKPEVAFGGGIPSLNADNWPSAQDIARALAILHKARYEVDNLWHSLSKSDKQIVSPPPEKR